MKKGILLLALFSFCSSGDLLSQKSFSSFEKELIYDASGPMAEEGTFQFIIINNKHQHGFTTDLLYFIEQNRKENEDVYIKMSDFVELYIPSRVKINSKDFNALEPIQQ